MKFHRFRHEDLSLYRQFVMKTIIHVAVTRQLVMHGRTQNLSRLSNANSHHPQIARAIVSISSSEKRSLQKEQKLERGITCPRAQARHGPW